MKLQKEKCLKNIRVGDVINDCYEVISLESKDHGKNYFGVRKVNHEPTNGFPKGYITGYSKDPAALDYYLTIKKKEK